MKERATCEHLLVGQKEDLTQYCFILILGSVAITINGSKPFEVSASGRFDHLPVVGIVSKIGSPDGAQAEVLSDTFAVRLSQQDLARMRESSEDIDTAWSALCGLRLHEAGLQLTSLTTATSA